MVMVKMMVHCGDSGNRDWIIVMIMIMVRTKTVKHSFAFSFPFSSVLRQRLHDCSVCPGGSSKTRQHCPPLLPPPILQGSLELYACHSKSSADRVWNRFLKNRTNSFLHKPSF